MSHTKVTGIVTRYVNYKDSDRILTIFTEEKGRVDAKARGCRRPKSPLLSCAQPFAYGEFQLFIGKDYYSVDQCDVRESFYPLREDYERLTAAFAMAALIQSTIQEEQPNEQLFSLLYHSLSFLCYSDAHPLDIAICFMLRFFNCNGLCPSITTCAICAADMRSEKAPVFFAEHGGAVCKNCADGPQSQRVSPLALEAMRRMLLLSDGEIKKIVLNVKLRKELFFIMRQYSEHILSKQIKAVNELEGLLND